MTTRKPTLVYRSRARLVFLLVALALAGCLLAPGVLWLAEILLDRKELKPGPEGPAPAEK